MGNKEKKEKKLVAMISTEGKSRKEISKLAGEAFDKFKSTVTQIEQEEKGNFLTPEEEDFNQFLQGIDIDKEFKARDARKNNKRK